MDAMTTVEQIDSLMETATRALMDTDYAQCERRCLEALGLAKAQQAWDVYARVVLPLQEARRQRRMTAAEGRLRLGSASLEGGPEAWLSEMPGGGCVVLTRPHGQDDAAKLHELALERELPIEVLWADNDVDAGVWTVRSFVEPALAVDRAGPAEHWRDRWIAPGQSLPSAPPEQSNGDSPGGSDPVVQSSETPADWIMDAMEALGDRALASLTDTEDPRQRLSRLEACITAAPDHEILHQELAATARQLLHAKRA